jgi:hypothetical protein
MTPHPPTRHRATPTEPDAPDAPAAPAAASSGTVVTPRHEVLR